MPTNQTENYQLSQWAKSDQVQMEDFNADNLKIDGALKAAADALAAVAAAIPKIVTGTYTGDGAAERFLDLGFTPKAVYICTSYGAAFTTGVNSSSAIGGLILPDGPLNASGVIFGQIVTGGVQLYHKKVDSSTRTTNSANLKYHYIALSW